jgi:hypothetical protein
VRIIKSAALKFRVLIYFIVFVISPLHHSHVTNAEKRKEGEKERAGEEQ